MASYIPTQQRGPIWQSSVPNAVARPGVRFPSVSSGSQRDYSGHHLGAPEFNMPTLGVIAQFVKTNAPSLLVGSRVISEEHKTQQVLESVSKSGDDISEDPAGQQAPAMGQPDWSVGSRLQRRGLPEPTFGTNLFGAAAKEGIPALEGPGVGRPNLLDNPTLVMGSRTQRRAGANLGRVTY